MMKYFISSILFLHLRVYEIKRFFGYYKINNEEPIKIEEGTPEGILLKAADRKLNTLNLVKFGSSMEWGAFEDDIPSLNFNLSEMHDDGLIRNKSEQTYTGLKLLQFIGYDII